MESKFPPISNSRQRKTHEIQVATAALILFGMAAWGFSVGNDPFPRTDLSKALCRYWGFRSAYRWQVMRATAG
jgi:hypothetical protein